MYPRLWIDLDNSPHVLLFAPLIASWRAEGWEVLVTARDFAQTLDLVRQHGLDAIAVGEHAGPNKLRKIANLPVRAAQLMRAVRAFAPEMALSHGSRTQAIAARMLRIPPVVMFDYEWTEMEILTRMAWRLLCPSAISPERLAEAGIPLGKVGWYEGFKEEVYLERFVPEAGFRSELGLSQSERLITIRPPGLIGNYHDSRSEGLCRRAIELACAEEGNHVVILPKTRLERAFVESALPATPRARVLVPEGALPGMQLLYHSQIVVSGGGTMNREAALLGVPAYSIFTGRRGAVDEELCRRGLLTFVEDSAALERIDWKGGAVRRDAPRRFTAFYDINRTIHMLADSRRDWSRRASTKGP